MTSYGILIKTEPIFLTYYTFSTEKPDTVTVALCSSADILLLSRYLDPIEGACSSKDKLVAFLTMG